MSINPAQGFIPEWTLGWRMQRAMGHAGMTTLEIAEAMDLSRTTVSRWMNDATKPKRAFLMQFALVTGTNLEWLETGNAPQPDGPEGVEGDDGCTRRDSNSQPSDP